MQFRVVAEEGLNTFMAVFTNAYFVGKINKVDTGSIKYVLTGIPIEKGKVNNFVLANTPKMPHTTIFFISELTLIVQKKCYKSGYTAGDLSKLAKHAKNASRTHAHTNATHGQSPNPHSEPIYTHK